VRIFKTLSFTLTAGLLLLFALWLLGIHDLLRNNLPTDISLTPIAQNPSPYPWSPEMNRSPQNEKSLPKKAPHQSDPESELSAIDQIVQQEALKIGRVDSNPNETEKRLLLIARGLTVNQLNRLTQIANDQSRNGDDRFIAVFFLGRSQNVQTIPLLLTVADSPLPYSASHGALYEQEVLVRSAALEEISVQTDRAQVRSELLKYLARQDKLALARHTQRLLNSITQRAGLASW
jgi:hypothetical protein